MRSTARWSIQAMSTNGPPAGSGSLPPRRYDALMADAFANAPDLVDLLEARLGEDLPARTRRVLAEVLEAPAHVAQLRTLLPALEAEHELGDLCAPAIAADVAAAAAAVAMLRETLERVTLEAPAAALRGQLVTVLGAARAAAPAIATLSSAAAAMLPAGEQEGTVAAHFCDAVDAIETPLAELAQLLQLLLAHEIPPR